MQFLLCIVDHTLNALADVGKKLCDKNTCKELMGNNSKKSYHTLSNLQIIQAYELCTIKKTCMI